MRYFDVTNDLRSLDPQRRLNDTAAAARNPWAASRAAHNPLQASISDQQSYLHEPEEDAIEINYASRQQSIPKPIKINPKPTAQLNFDQSFEGGESADRRLRGPEDLGLEQPPAHQRSPSRQKPAFRGPSNAKIVYPETEETEQPNRNPTHIDYSQSEDDHFAGVNSSLHTGPNKPSEDYLRMKQMYLKSVQAERQAQRRVPSYMAEEQNPQKAAQERVERQRQQLVNKLNALRYGREHPPAGYLDGRSVSTIREESAISRTVPGRLASGMSEMPWVTKLPAVKSTQPKTKPAVPLQITSQDRAKAQSQTAYGKYRFDTKLLSEQAKEKEYVSRREKKKKFDDYIRLGLQGVKQPQNPTKGEWFRLASGKEDVDRRTLVEKVKLADKLIDFRIQKKRVEEKIDKVKDEELGYLKAIKTKMELLNQGMV